MLHMGFESVTTSSCDAILTPTEAETWGFLQGINWIVMKGYWSVIFGWIVRQ